VDGIPAYRAMAQPAFLGHNQLPDYCSNRSSSDLFQQVTFKPGMESCCVFGL
jgi:hypothetical protein